MNESDDESYDSEYSEVESPQIDKKVNMFDQNTAPNDKSSTKRHSKSISVNDVDDAEGMESVNLDSSEEKDTHRKKRRSNRKKHKKKDKKRKRPTRKTSRKRSSMGKLMAQKMQANEEENQKMKEEMNAEL